MLQLLAFIRPFSFQLISGHKDGHIGEFSKPVGLRGFPSGNFFSNLTNVFVSVTVFPLNLAVRVSFAFLVPEEAELL